MTMRVLFRADAGRSIGTGHVMRCLVLADRLAGEGAASLFVCRDQEGHLAALVKSRGHECLLLPVDDDPPRDAGYETDPPAHANWLSADWRDDADATADIAGHAGPIDLMVVDHYALDQRWQARMAQSAGRIMVIDDLADRRHECDILIDQNYGHDPSVYTGLVPERCQILAGPAYALMRPRFAALRPKALARRRAIGPSRHLLIFLGGGRTERALRRVGDALSRLQERALSAITIVAGGATNANAVAGQLRDALGLPVKLISRVDDMAMLMTEVDLAIGGGGVSAWERCALGLPSLVVIIADNQARIGRKLAKDGICHACVTPEDLQPDLLADFISMSADTYRAISDRAANIADGRGADRIMEAFDLAAV